MNVPVPDDIAARENHVPGEPVIVRWTPVGMEISSGDLDALDSMERLVRNRLKKTKPSPSNQIKILPIVNRQAAIIKLRIDELFGLSSGGGGLTGTGGMGDMMSNIASNAMGGMGGDLLGGLLGGGSTSSASGSGSMKFEGLNVDIAVEADLNWIIVTGATNKDIATITQLVQTFDIKVPPQTIRMIDVYMVPVIHRDPTDLQGKISAHSRNTSSAPAVKAESRTRQTSKAWLNK